MNAVLLRCPLCGSVCQTLARSLTSSLPECDQAGHRTPVPANDNQPIERPCLLGSWRLGRCPYRSCDLADECTAPVPANDNEPGQSGSPASPYPFPDRVLP